MPDLHQWLLIQPDLTVYGVLFALLLSGALGFPPEDLTLILSGICYHQGKGQLPVLFALCYIGTILGDLFIYGVGRWFGKALFAKPWFQRRVRPGRIKIMRSGLERRGLSMIFIARHLFYLRTLTFLSCGALKMKFAKFLFADCLSALVSVPLMLFLGYQASDAAFHLIGQAKLLSLLVILAAFFIILFILFMRRRANEEKPEENERES